MITFMDFYAKPFCNVALNAFQTIKLLPVLGEMGQNNQIGNYNKIYFVTFLLNS